MKKFLALAFFTTMFTALSAFNISAQEMMKKDEMAMKEDKRPIVAVIKADWCSYCKRVDPVMMKLMEDYGEKLKFVIFDVTNEETTAEAAKTAESLGISDFFSKNKNKTSTVAVFKDKEVIYKTSNNKERNDYIKAFENVLK